VFIRGAICSSSSSALASFRSPAGKGFRRRRAEIAGHRGHHLRSREGTRLANQQIEIPENHPDSRHTSVRRGDALTRAECSANYGNGTTENQPTARFCVECLMTLRLATAVFSARNCLHPRTRLDRVVLALIADRYNSLNTKLTAHTEGF
jgi:hypothetical protein